MAFALRLTLQRLSTGGALRARPLSLTSLYQGRIVPYKLADIGEGILEVTVKEWHVKPGDAVSQFDNICEVQSDKASVTITSRYSGIVKTLHHKVDETCRVGSALIDIELEDDEPAEPASQPEPASAEPADKSAPMSKALTTPAVRRIAKENEVDLARVPATGKDGRVLKEDILAYLAEAAAKLDQGPTEAKLDEGPTALRAGSDAGPAPPDKKYAKHMWRSMTQALTIPHFMYSDECDVTKLVKLRAEVKEAFQCQGLALSYMPFFMKAISRALLQYPELNALIDETNESTCLRREHNISLAMDTPGGLVVPNIKNVQDLSIVDLARELNRLQALGKKAAIPPQDLTGGTFSISNIGIIGGTYAKPVILSPQVVIGALGKIQRLPRFDAHDNVIAANILTVSWAADHRVVDGVTMAKFSNLWKHYVENPSHLIMGL